MAAKFIVIALAVASASASCLSSFQEDFSFGQCGEVAQAVTVEAAPRMELVQPAQRVEIVKQAPRVEIVQSSPRMELVQQAPRMELVQQAPRMELVQQAPRMEFVQSAPRMEFVQASPAVEVATQVASTGPQVSTRSLPVVQAPSVTLNPVESPIVRLPSAPVPGPRVIRHQCFCTKTVVRPQVIQRTVTVPRIQRYLKQSYKPIVENVSYQARPIGTDARGEDIIISGSSAPSTQEVAIPVRTQEVAIPVRTQEVAIPVRTQEVAIPVRTQEVAIPVTQEVVRAPVNIGIFQESGDCQCEQSYQGCY